MLPLSFVANTSFPYEEKLAAARGFLLTQGITNPRPIRKSLPRSEAYEAWLQRSKPRLRLVKGVPAH